MGRPVDRDKLVMALCDRLIALPLAQRTAILDVTCADDPSLRSDVEELLDSIENSGQFMALDDQESEA